MLLLALKQCTSNHSYIKQVNKHRFSDKYINTKISIQESRLLLVVIISSYLYDLRFKGNFL